MIRTAAAALGAALLLATPAFAAPAQAQSVRITLAGKSAAQVHTEIVKAASQVCYAQTRTDQLFSYLYTACIRDSVGNAVAQLGDPAVLAYSKANPARVATR